MNQLFRWDQTGLFLLALAAGILPFAVPEVCAAALREGLTLCSGPLLLSLFPFLVVSRLLIQCPESDLLALPFRLAAWGIGIRTPCAARVLCIGFLGGFAPAASAAAQAVRTGQLTAEEADALLPACICSGPSFVVLTVGQSLLGSAELGVLLFASQITANYLTAALLNRFAGVRSVKPESAAPASPASPRLDEILADAAITYCKLCGFILFFRMLAAGAGALLPAGAGTLCSILLEVCSGCDLASRTGRWGSLLCCAALSVQGLSVLLQVRTICPPEMTIHELIVLICAVFLGQLHSLIDDNTGLTLVAIQHLSQRQTQDSQADTGQALHGPVAQMVTDEVVHLCRVAVIGTQQALAEHIHRALFPTLVVCIQCFLQGHITKGLGKSQQERILTGFTTGQNIFHNLPLLLFIPVPQPQGRQ